MPREVISFAREGEDGDVLVYCKCAEAWIDPRTKAICKHQLAFIALINKTITNKLYH